jgi:hypothetical protein
VDDVSNLPTSARPDRDELPDDLLDGIPADWTGPPADQPGMPAILVAAIHRVLEERRAGRPQFAGFDDRI